MNQIKSIFRVFMSPIVWARLVGLLFIVASLLKAQDHSSVKPTLEWLGVSGSFLQVAVLFLIIFEAILGVLLIIEGRSISLRLFTLVLLGAYSVFLLSLMVSKDPPICNCLGKWMAFEDARVSNFVGLLRNGVLICWGVWIIIRNRSTQLALGANHAAADQNPASVFTG